MLPLNLLFKRFFKIGATAYGGPAIAGQMKKVVVKDHGWLKEQEFMQGMALCQMLPGATWVMMATYIGYRLRRFWGALVCAIAFVLPAFLLLLVLSAIYFQLGDLWFIKSLFKGLSAMVVAIVLNAVIGFSRPIIKDWKIALISLLSFLGFLFRWNTVLVFLLAGLAALFLRPKENKSGSPLSPSGAGLITRRREDYFVWGGLAGLVIAGFVFCYIVHTQLFYLSLTLSKVGALAFGGGFTIIPLIQYDVVDRYQWVTTKEFLDGIAMGQVTPGPVMITSTFLGYKVAGFAGAVMATLAIFSPPFFLISLLIPYYDRLKGMKLVRTMEQGILASFIGMLALVLYNFGRTTFVDLPTAFFAGAAFVALLKKVDLAIILLAGAILSVLLFGLLLV